MAGVDWDKLESGVYDHQESWIKEAFGQRAMDAANYGWAVVCDDPLEVSTKVYGHGVLTTVVRSDGTMSDTWQDYY